MYVLLSVLAGSESTRCLLRGLSTAAFSLCREQLTTSGHFRSEIRRFRWANEAGNGILPRSYIVVEPEPLNPLCIRLISRQPRPLVLLLVTGGQAYASGVGCRACRGKVYVVTMQLVQQQATRVNRRLDFGLFGQYVCRAGRQVYGFDGTFHRTKDVQGRSVNVCVRHLRRVNRGSGRVQAGGTRPVPQ